MRQPTPGVNRVNGIKKRLMFIFDWLGFLLLVCLSLPLLYCIARAFVRAMMLDQ